MEKYNKTLAHIDFNTIVFIIGNSQNCFVFEVEGKVSILQCSLDDVHKKNDFPGFLKINEFTLINTKFYTGKKPGRLISLKGGSMHKVSRKFRKCIM